MYDFNILNNNNNNPSNIVINGSNTQNTHSLLSLDPSINELIDYKLLTNDSNIQSNTQTVVNTQTAVTNTQSQTHRRCLYSNDIKLILQLQLKRLITLNAINKVSNIFFSVCPSVCLSVCLYVICLFVCLIGCFRIYLFNYIFFNIIFDFIFFCYFNFLLFIYF